MGALRIFTQLAAIGVEPAQASYRIHRVVVTTLLDADDSPRQSLLLRMNAVTSVNFRRTQLCCSRGWLAHLGSAAITVQLKRTKGFQLSYLIPACGLTPL